MNKPFILSADLALPELCILISIPFLNEKQQI